MNPTKAILPFNSNSEYLETEHRWLVARAARIGLQRRLEQDTGHGAIANQRKWPVDETMLTEYRERVGQAEAVERGLRDQIDERLAVHRATPGACTLGLDKVCEDYNLNEDERTVLLIATVTAIGNHHADLISAALSGSRHYSQTVDDVITLLDPRDATEAVKARLIFRPDAPLVRAGLITVEVHDKHTTPADLLEARVYVTFKALGVMVGVPELAEVDWASAAPTPETPAAT